jgi:hypothetical protein
MPVAFPTDSEPIAIRGRYKPGDVAIDCRGEVGLVLCTILGLRLKLLKI